MSRISRYNEDKKSAATSTTYMQHAAPSRPSASKRPPTVKLLMIGNSGVGKSCLLLRFADDEFKPSFLPTIGIDFRVREVAVEGARLRLQIWDTAGQERFKTITRAYYRGAQGVALVYDVTDASSFQAISGWVESLDQHASRKICKILVANKCDRGDRRQITAQQGEKLAAEHGFHYIETSAKTGLHVDEMFMKLAKDVKRLSIDPLFAEDGGYDNDGATEGDEKKQKKDVVDLKPPKQTFFRSCCQS